MESSNRKIYRDLRVVLLLLVILIAPAGKTQNTDSAKRIEVENLKIPIYQEGRDIPVLILYSAKAKPIGIRFEMKGVRLDWLGDSIKEIKGRVETSTAIYDQSTKKVGGNKKITYRSKELDINGIGFDIDQAKQTIHIRSEVEVILKGDFSTTKQLRKEKKKTGKKGGALSLVPTTKKGKSEKNKGNSKLKQLLNEITVNPQSTKEKTK